MISTYSIFLKNKIYINFNFYDIDFDQIINFNCLDVNNQVPNFKLSPFLQGYIIYILRSTPLSRVKTVADSGRHVMV